MRYVPKIYQQHGEQHIIDTPGGGLFLDMGLGKTATVLSAIVRLKRSGQAKKALIIAPKKVAINTWPAEIEKWDEFRHLRYSVVVGTEKQRLEALRKKADIYITNVDQTEWIAAQFGTAWNFDFTVLDESSKFKNHQAKRFKALRAIAPLIKRIVLLSGTPMPKGLLDLWPQIYLLDQGARLEKTVGAYREKYFIPGRRKGHVIYEYNLKTVEEDFIGEDYNEALIREKISDICISMKSEDWLELPERIDRFVSIKMTAETRKKYEEFEKESVLALGDIDVEDITAVNAAVLSGKLLQFTNGAIYTTKPDYYEIHDEKIEALEEILDAANGHPVLLFYNFRHDIERIRLKLAKYRPHVLTSNPEDIKKWNRKEIPFMIASPVGDSMGLNLQAGGNIIIWFGISWNLENYLQANKRVHRQGQTEKVIIHHIVMENTVDDLVAQSLDDKEKRQTRLLNGLKAIVSKYRN